MDRYFIVHFAGKLNATGAVSTIMFRVKYLFDALPPGSFAGKLTVRDNGIGFEQPYADRVFEVFQRLHDKNEYEGTGIGLAICKKIMQNHKGTILAGSEPGVGTALFYYFQKMLTADFTRNKKAL